MVGPGALKPSVGDGIESRRPLVCSYYSCVLSLCLLLFLSHFFCSLCVCVYTFGGVYVNNNNNNNNTL